MLAPEFNELAALDFTEIPGLDDLHVPQGIIAEAQQLLARACGARHSYFLINGATSGLHALLLGLPANAPVIIPRNAHRAFYGGLVLSGGWPVYIPCEIEPELGIAVAVNPQIVKRLIMENPDAEAVWATSPSYFGTCGDITGLAAISKQAQKMLFVDEAHGSHFYFHPQYPDSALSQGAAAVVNGLHKTWPALTQTACLHLGDGFKAKRRLEQALDLLTTTSPSYPLMASIDLARDFMQRQGYNYLDQALEISGEFKCHLSKIKGIKLYDRELTQINGVKAVDPLKILIGVPGLSITGGQIDKILADQYRIQVEMSGERYILAMFSLAHQREDWQRFYLALKDIADRYLVGQRKMPAVTVPPLTRMVLTPRQAYFARKKTVPLAECRGKTAGQPVVPYPPGIPCLLPGEEITDEVWEYLDYVRANKLYFQGVQSPDLSTILIIDHL
jgi:arginine decarboxylase